MNTGRNLTVASVGIILYVLSGADFRAAGVGGLSWEIEYPGVIKVAVIVFWFWLLILHWLTIKNGDYYKAWVTNAARHRHGKIGVEGHERSAEARADGLARLAEYFGVTLLPNAGSALTYAHVFADGPEKPGVYIAQCTKHRAMGSEETGGFLKTTPQWQLPPISPRIGFLALHWRFKGVFFRTLFNNPEVLSRRILPWVFAAAAFVVIVTDQRSELLNSIGPWVESKLAAGAGENEMINHRF